MVARNLAFICISLLLGLGCIYLIRRLDRYEREPFGKLVLTTIGGGGAAAGIALGVFALVEHLGFEAFTSATGTLLVIGPLEELAKLAGLLLVIGFIRDELNEPADGIIYIACVALGFSLVENYLYAAAPDQAYLLFIRLLVGTPLHICFSALMGITFYLCYRYRQPLRLMVPAFLLASLSHGFYNLMVFNRYSVLLLGAALICIYVFTRNLFLYALAVSPQRLSLAQTLAITAPQKVPIERTCPHCGIKGVQTRYSVAGASLAHCNACDYTNTTKKGVQRLFFHFAGVRHTAAETQLSPDRTDDGHLTRYADNPIFRQSQRPYFRLADLDAILERGHYALKSRMRALWYLPHNLGRLEHANTSVDHAKMARDGAADFWRGLLLPPGAKARRLYGPPRGGPRWNWSAFLLPELWYLLHGLGRVALFIAALYLLGVYLSWTLATPLILGGLLIGVRLYSGLWASRLFYRSHGKWPRRRG